MEASRREEKIYYNSQALTLDVFRQADGCGSQEYAECQI